MKTLKVLSVCVLSWLLLASFNYQDWGEWNATDYPGIFCRVKMDHYNEYAHKYQWMYQFRNAYSKQVSVNYSFTSQADKYTCRPDHTTTIDAESNSDTGAVLLNEADRVHLCVGGLVFK